MTKRSLSLHGSVWTPLLLGCVFSLSFLSCGSSKGNVFDRSKLQQELYQNFLREDAAPIVSDNCGDACQELRKEFRYVVYVGQQIYAYWDLKKADTKIDYSALAKDLESRINDNTSPSKYYLILREWAAAFHDGHVNAMMKDDVSDIEIYSADIRFETLAPATERESLIVVKSAFPDAKIGDEVLEVNGVPAREALTLQERDVSGSTARMRRASAANRLSDAIGIENGSQTLKLRLRRAGGQPFDVEVARSVVLNPPLSSPPVPPAESTGVDLFKATIMLGNIGYLRIDGFSGTKSSELLQQAVDRLSRCSGLIIDLRKNGGGDQSGSLILAQIAGRAIERYQVSENLSPFLLHARPYYFGLPADGDSGFAQWHPVLVQPPEKGAAFKGKPVFALTSPRCFSACDTFVAGLAANGLGKVYGEGTGGGTGSPLVFELPFSGQGFRYSVVRGRTANGDIIEGQGTVPNVLVEPQISDRMTGSDSQLAQVYAAMQTELKQTGDSRDLSAMAMEAAAKIVAQFGAVSEQTLDVSPTILEERLLKRFAHSDELE